jgi:F-type H+-transporting ATPase subunit b
MTIGIHEILRTSGEAANPLLPAPADLIWSAVVFLILLVFFWFKVLPNFKKNIDARTEAIEGRLALAEKAQAEAAAKTANIEAQQAEAVAERAEMINKARSEAAAASAEIIEKANAEAAMRLQNAQKQIEEAREQAVRSLRSEVGVLAVELASAVVKQNLKEDKNSAGIVDDFLAELNKDGKNN